MYLRSWAKIRRAGGAVLVLTLAARCGEPAGTAEPAPVVPGPVTTASAVDGTRCLGFNGLDALNPPVRLRAGLFRQPGTAAVRVAAGTNVDWGLDPYHDRTWQLWFHSLEWVGGALKEFGRTRDPALLDLAVGIVKDWLADNDTPGRFGKDRREAIAEGTKFRLVTLMCLRRYYRARWLDAAITRHAEWLDRPEHYSGPWNHGTDESMTLMTAGCGIGRGDLADLGRRRLLDAMLRPPGGARPAVDAEGASNEQSTHYSVYNRARWRMAFQVMRACGRPVPAELLRRHALMDEFIAFQSTPGGDLLQIGESYAAKASYVGFPGKGPLRYVATQGVKGAPPKARARVYQAGYVMGRSGWGGTVRPGKEGSADGRAEGGRPYTAEMAYTARFGPGRYAHGQNDHMALTFYALGTDILVPSGHIGYSDPGWNAWLRSPAAHNTLVVRDAPFREGAPTALTAHRFRRGADTFRFSDTAYAGTTRSRSVLAACDPDALVVLDEARSTTPRVVEQMWHLPPAFTAVVDGTGAVATAGPVRVHFLRIPLPGTAPLPAQVIRGSLDPPQGWVVPAARRTLPASAVSLPAQGAQVRMLTLIAPVRGEERPSVRTLPLPGGRVRVEAAFSGRRLVVEAAPDGTLRRLP